MARMFLNGNEIYGNVNMGEGGDVANPNIADVYDPTQTYNTGDRRIYNDVLYVCNDDNVTGAWDNTKWDSATIDEIISALTASDIQYTSGVSVADKLDSLNGLVKIVFSGNISKTLTANQNLGILGTEIIPAESMPSGYTVIGLLSSYSTNNNCIMYSYDATAVGTSGTFCFIKNNMASSQSITVNYRILFMKSAYVT